MSGQDKGQTRWKQLLRGAVFLLVLTIAVVSVSGMFGVDTNHPYENMRLFLKEKPGSLDAVFIGSSAVHRFWLPLYGWAQHGLAVWNYSVDHMPAEAIKYMMIEGRKTQPDALYIVCLNVFGKDEDDVTVDRIHRLVDYLPMSLNRIQMTEALCRGKDISFLDRLEYYFPIIRFHTRWDNLSELVYEAQNYDYKSSSHNSSFNKDILDVSGLYRVYDTEMSAAEDLTVILDDLLDYCDEKKERVLFVKMPQVMEEEDQARLANIQSRVEERGYPCVDFLKGSDDLLLDYTQDFYNKKHTNVHGALKVSDALSTYLFEHYDLKDKRGQAGWESWDACADKYMNSYLAPYYLPIELSLENRTAEEAPTLERPSVSGKEVTLYWWGAEWADGFEIFRKEKNKSWKSVASVDGETQSYTVKKLKEETQYSFTVVPYREENGRKLYGKFNVSGVSAETGGK
jgi:hypothetical protein